jgi:hypothetical protein
MSCVLGIKASFVGSKHCPGRSFGHIILCTEGLCSAAVLVPLDECLKAVIVNPRPPFTINLKLERKQVLQSEITPSTEKMKQIPNITNFFYHIKILPCSKCGI